MDASPTINPPSLVAQFLDQSMPASAWTHAAHLRVAYWHLEQYPYYDALCRIKAGIILLNQAHGTPNHATRGYHETLTQFWMQVVAWYQEAHPEATGEAGVAAFLASPWAANDLHLNFYAAADIQDPAYRAQGLPPRLRPLSGEELRALG